MGIVYIISNNVHVIISLVEPGLISVCYITMKIVTALWDSF